MINFHIYYIFVRKKGDPNWEQEKVKKEKTGEKLKENKLVKLN